MKRLMALMFLLQAVLAAPALAATTNFLKIDSIEGESTAKGFEKQIAVRDWQWSVSNNGGGAVFGDFVWSQGVDKSVVPMFLGVANGTQYKSAILTVTEPTGGSLPGAFFEMTFSNVLLKSLSTNGGGAIEVSGALTYDSLKMRYRPQNSDGSFGSWIEGTFTITPARVLSLAGDPGVVQGLFASGGNVNLQSFSVTPVPEPLTWVMLLAGLALLAGTAGRRGSLLPHPA